MFFMRLIQRAKPKDSGSADKVYGGTGPEGSFVLPERLRRKAMAALDKDDVLKAVRLLYRAKLPWRQIQAFLVEEMDLFYPATWVLNPWDPNQSDKDQLHLVTRMKAVNEICRKTVERSAAEKAARANRETNTAASDSD